jgi:hypothetical protein
MSFAVKRAAPKVIGLHAARCITQNNNRRALAVPDIWAARRPALLPSHMPLPPHPPTLHAGGFQQGGEAEGAGGGAEARIPLQAAQPQVSQQDREWCEDLGPRCPHPRTTASMFVDLSRKTMECPCPCTGAQAHTRPPLLPLPRPQVGRCHVSAGLRRCV